MILLSYHILLRLNKVWTRVFWETSSETQEKHENVISWTDYIRPSKNKNKIKNHIRGQTERERETPKILKTNPNLYFRRRRRRRRRCQAWRTPSKRKIRSRMISLLTSIWKSRARSLYIFGLWFCFCIYLTPCLVTEKVEGKLEF